jgi:hypothetical protein
VVNSLFTLFPSVFVGCSLSDEDLEPLKFLTAVLGTNVTKHFAILEQPTEAMELLGDGKLKRAMTALFTHVADVSPVRCALSTARSVAVRLRLERKFRIAAVFYPASDNHQALSPMRLPLRAGDRRFSGQTILQSMDSARMNGAFLRPEQGFSCS